MLLGEHHCQTLYSLLTAYVFPSVIILIWPLPPPIETFHSSPAANPHLNSNQQDEIQSDLTSLLQSTFTSSDDSIPAASSSRTFLQQMSETLMILPGRKAWLLNLDAVVLSDGGNVHDILFMACRAALWSTRVPKTKAVEYRDTTQKRTTGEDAEGEDSEMADLWKASVQTKKATKAADFELDDYWDHGEPLAGRARCPVAVTLNIVSARLRVFTLAYRFNSVHVMLRCLITFRTSYRPFIYSMQHVPRNKPSHSD